MRYLLVCAAVLSVISAMGCVDRQNMRVVPNREGRPGGDGSQHVGDGGFGPVANPTEHYYSMEAGDTVYTVGKKFNVTAEWLIKRNEITDTAVLKQGKTLIVPGK